MDPRLVVLDGIVLPALGSPAVRVMHPWVWFLSVLALAVAAGAVFPVARHQGCWPAVSGVTEEQCP
jgi:hypothetical protein